MRPTEMMRIKIAAETITTTPIADGDGQALTFGKVQHIFSPLKTTVMLLADGDKEVCLVTSHWLGVHYYCYSNILRRAVSDSLQIPFDNVLVFGSHNHTSAALNQGGGRVMGKQERYTFRPLDDLTSDGRQLLSQVVETAAKLPSRMEHVQVCWGLGHEGRITHHNKGRRADGSTYMIREEDRLELSQIDYRGYIDTSAPVVAFVGNDGKPRAFLAQFAGHPVTAYHPDYAIVHGEYPQVACDDLSDAFGGVPVGFLQGCGADAHSMYSFTSRPVEQIIALAEQNGHLLGETYIEAAGRLHSSDRQDLCIAWQDAKLSFCQLPARESLQKSLANIETYLQCLENGEDLRDCEGLHFATSFSLPHRRALVEPVRKWTKWALSFHEENRIQDVPKGIVTPVMALRIGDIGITGLACEPFQNIGRLTRALSPLPLTIPCGYLNDTTIVNVPDSANNGDMDFMSSTYRYTTNMLQYAQPAGDLLAYASAEMLGATL